MSKESKQEYPNEDILVQFKSDEEFEHWTASLTKVKPEEAWDFDPDAHQNQDSGTFIHLDRQLIEGYQKLATVKGFCHPQSLIVSVLEEYLKKQTISEESIRT
jgi:hypothetical protein